MKNLLFLALAVVLLSACGKEVRPPSEDSVIALESFDLAENLRSAYVKKDFKAFKKYCTETGYSGIKKELKEFDSVELSFTPRWVEIEKDTVYLNVSWEGRWTAKGKTYEERGMAVFELKERPLKLNRILRGSPFKHPEVKDIF